HERVARVDHALREHRALLQREAVIAPEVDGAVVVGPHLHRRAGGVRERRERDGGGARARAPVPRGEAGTEHPGKLGLPAARAIRRARGGGFSAEVVRQLCSLASTLISGTEASAFEIGQFLMLKATFSSKVF